MGWPLATLLLWGGWYHVWLQWFLKWMYIILIPALWIEYPLLCIAFLGFITVGGIIFNKTFTPDESKYHFVAYWMVPKKRVSNMHFLTPRYLREALHATNEIRALKQLKKFIEELPNYDIDRLFATTNIPHDILSRLGFTRLVPASPADWILIVMQHHAVKGEWHLQWPWMYRYIPPSNENAAHNKE